MYKVNLVFILKILIKFFFVKIINFLEKVLIVVDFIVDVLEKCKVFCGVIKKVKEDLMFCLWVICVKGVKI